MQLSNQAIGAIMMALQESLLHQSDIVPVFQGFELEECEEGLVVKNPPTVHVASVEAFEQPDTTGK
tara:strand:- start:922 stop:1119 length:198 start_codon:yes stop_codon:yes gene_type:complete